MRSGNTACNFDRAATFNVMVLTVVMVMAVATSTFAQMGGGSPELQQKLAALKQAATQNKQALQQYQWVETTTVSYKGEPKPPKQDLCRYGPNGQVQKVPIGEPQQQQQQDSGRRGRLKEHVVEKKTSEIEDYMQQVKSVISMYVPPDPQRMQKAFQAHNVSIVPGGGAAQLVFKNYAQPGDQMTISFDPAAKKIQSLDVKSYVGDPKSTISLAAQFASLPEGPNYVSQTVLNAPAKDIQVTTTNSQYSKLTQ
jgi:hypothetical protein